jgi:predicted DNA-binding transcriptional regulator AlpA
MKTFSTRQVAKQLGITHVTLIKYITQKRIPAPKAVSSGGMTIHLWTAGEIEHVRELLPKLANGRKTRHKKTQPKTAVSHKQRKPKKKK